MGDYTSYIAGVSIALASSFMSAVGLTAQKRVHKQLDSEKIDPKKRRYFLHPTWLLGIGCMLGGALLSFAVFAFLGQARASAMASITIFWNSGLSAMFLGETFTPVDALTSAIIIAGASVAVVFGSSGAASQAVQTVDTLVAALQRQVAWSGAIVLVAVYAAAYAFVWRSHAQRLLGTRTETGKRLECAVRVCMAGLFSGSTGMLAKNVVVCISQGAREHNIAFAARFEFWLFVLSLPPSLILQLFYLNSSLAQLDALEVVPPYQCSIILVGLAWGFTFGEEAATSSSTAIALFATGCFISCLGVTVLMFKRRLLKLLDSARIARGLPAKYTITKVTSEEAAAVTPTLEDDVTGIIDEAPTPKRRRSNANEMHALVDALRQEEPHAVVVLPHEHVEAGVTPSVVQMAKFHTRRKVDVGHSHPVRVRRETAPRAAPPARGPVHSSVGEAILEQARASGDAADHYAEHIAMDVSTESMTLWTSVLHVLGNFFRPLAWLSVQPFHMRHAVSEHLLRMLPARRASTVQSHADGSGAAAMPAPSAAPSSDASARSAEPTGAPAGHVSPTEASSANASPHMLPKQVVLDRALAPLELPPVVTAPAAPLPPSQPRASIISPVTTEAIASNGHDAPALEQQRAPTLPGAPIPALGSPAATSNGVHAQLPGTVARPPRGPQRGNGMSSGQSSVHTSPSTSPFTSRASSPFTTFSVPPTWPNVTAVVVSAPSAAPVPADAQHVSLMVNPFLAASPSSRGDRVHALRSLATVERPLQDGTSGNSSSRAASPTS